jgi:hypothetical protein
MKFSRSYSKSSDKSRSGAVSKTAYSSRKVDEIVHKSVARESGNFRLTEGQRKTLKDA